MSLSRASFLAVIPLTAVFAAATTQCKSSDGTDNAGGAPATSTSPSTSTEKGTGAGPTTTGPTTTTTTGSGGHGGSGMPGASVLMHHNNPSRDGVIIDPVITAVSAPNMHMDPAFQAQIQGAVFAQPLYLDGSANNGKDVLIVATEEDWVYALDAATGAKIWSKQLGTPVSPNTGAAQCGNIDPYGITGTPVIDLMTRTVFLDAMTTPDNGNTGKHLVFGLSIDDGSTRSGFPIDANASFKSGNITFDSSVQGARGSLLIVGRTVYVPYGGYWGDCGNYHGWVVGISIDNPGSIQAYATRAQGGGIWAPGGVSSDGQSIFAATGNTFGANSWQDGEAILRLAPGPTFSQQTADYFAPSNWKQLDNGDVDIGGSGPVVFDAPAATPSALVMSLGKDGNAYLLDRGNLGGVSDGLAKQHVSGSQIINAAVAYTAANGTYVAFKGPGTSCPNGNGDLTALKIAGAPPTISTAWCAKQNGSGSPMVTMSAPGKDAIVWSLGAEGDQRLHGFDGDTGATVFGGGGGGDMMNGLRRFNTPIAAKGRIYVAGSNQVYAFTTQ